MTQEETSIALTAEQLKEIYPSIELTYPLAIASYDVARVRLDAMDNRIQTLMMIGSTVSSALIVLLSGRGLRPASGWFILAMLAFLAALVVGTYGRLFGVLGVIGIKTLFDSYLGLAEVEFKKDMIYYAGKTLRENIALIKRKNDLAAWSMALFGLELICLSVWAVLHSS
jgi:hypothetical protein